MNVKKLIISVTLMVIISLFLGGTTSKATLQSNSTTQSAGLSKVGGYWIKEIRKMESSGGTMGLSETIDETTLLSTSGDNNIDVHMIKSTEYGAIAILSASGYGNPQKLSESTIKSTTGNATGVYMGTEGTITACNLGVDLGGYASQYYDDYKDGSSYTPRIGDGITLAPKDNYYACGSTGEAYSGGTTWISVWHSNITTKLQGYGSGLFRGWNGMDYTGGIFAFTTYRGEFLDTLYGRSCGSCRGVATAGDVGTFGD